MNTHYPPPVDQAIDPARHFTTEAFQWWSEEEEAYGALLLDGFEVHGARLPDHITADLDACFINDCEDELPSRIPNRALKLISARKRAARASPMPDQPNQPDQPSSAPPSILSSPKEDDESPH